MIKVDSVTNKSIVDSINTLEELQQLVDTNPALYFENLYGKHGFGCSEKFPIAEFQLKFSEDVIYEYAGRGLSVYLMLRKPDISEELRYYLRTLYHGLEKTNELYFNPELWAKNETLTMKIAELRDRDNELDCTEEDRINELDCTEGTWCSSAYCEKSDIEYQLGELLVHYMI